MPNRIGAKKHTKANRTDKLIDIKTEIAITKYENAEPFPSKTGQKPNRPR